MLWAGCWSCGAISPHHVTMKGSGEPGGLLGLRAEWFRCPTTTAVGGRSAAWLSRYGPAKSSPGPDPVSFVFFFACFHFKQMLCCEKHLGWGWVEGGRGSMGFVGPCQDCQQTIHCLTRIQCPWLIPAFYFIIFFPREINDIF